MRQEIFITEELAGDRIDKFLSEQCEGLSRSFIQKLLKSGEVFVGQKPVKASYKVSEGDVITFEVPEAVEPEIVAEDIPLDIVYEDHDVILVNKPKGMVVHPAAGHYSGTLVNALMFHCKDD
ncbi:MAG: RluA family pseudouridine synthase, partial [Lachnospiraceae bacterium]|nr:RluA family pseudouridine synthase [Lachnospiraceae bacterium]